MPDYTAKKYRDDRVFQLISRRYLTLHDDEVHANNAHLKWVLEVRFIPLMREDPLFKAVFQRVMYGGSYYKGTKVGKPDEFDLDFVIKLPIDYSKITIDTNHNEYGYVKIKLDTKGKMHPDWERYELSKWLTSDNYLDQNKFRAWMEGVVAKAYGGLPNYTEGAKSTVMLKKSGPAFTMKITHIPTGTAMDLDLVPCLEFDNMPLKNGYRSSSGSIKKWMVFAKPLSPSKPNHNILWGHDCSQQEKEFLRGEVKPVIRMMKKFRDTMKWKISSYCVETIFYHELYKLQDYKYEFETFLRAPKTGLFVHGLRKLKDAFERKNLPYFWHPALNLIGNLGNAEIEGYANLLNRIINKIDAQIERNGFILADVVLEPHESQIIKEEGLLMGISSMRI